MANGFGSMYIGQSGLQNAQNALNTTANNLANVDTTGYVRQQVVFTDKRYDTLVNSTTQTYAQQSGLGVSIGDVVHARDVFLDKSYRLERGREAFYDVCYETTSYVEDLLQELDGVEFKASVEDLWTAFQELAKTPADSVTQNLVIQKAELLLSRSQSLYSELQSYQMNINDQIKDDIKSLNEMAERVYELNLEIQKVESNGRETAMTLRDERDYLLDQMSAYANINVKEDALGFVYISIEGVEYVSEMGVSTISTYTAKGTGFAIPYWEKLSDEQKEQYVTVFHAEGDVSTEKNTDVGSIKAKLYMRGDTYGIYTDLLTEEAYTKIEDRLLVEVEAELDLLFRNIITEVNDIFAPNEETQAPVGGLTDAEGNVLYAAGSTIKILDTANCAVGADGELPPRELFARMGVDRYTKAYDAEGNVYYVYNEENPSDPNTLYRIGNIEVQEDLTRQVTLLPGFNQDGAVAYDLGERLAAIWEVQGMHISPNDQYPCTFQEFYDKMISKLGTDGNVYNSALTTLNNTVTQVDGQRAQIMGVSSDEELAKLVKYQAAYNAASRYMTVISQMTELIVTGLI